MPSKSSSEFSLQKSKGFHLKLLSKQKKPTKISSSYSSSFIPLIPTQKSQTSATRNTSSDSSHNKDSNSNSRGLIDIASKIGKKQGSRLQNERRWIKRHKSELTKVQDLKKSVSKNYFKVFCTNTVNRSQLSNVKETLIAAKKTFASSFRKEKPLTFQKADKQETSNKVVSLPNDLTVEAIKYKCKILQFHDKTCGCSSPRLHIYLTTNHRCGEKCSAETVLCSKNIEPSSSLDIAKNKYIFKIMTGKSKAKSNPRKSTTGQNARKTLKKSSIKTLANSTSSTRKIVKRNRDEEPESELLGEVCESLPGIMNTLSGDVEFVVLDDNTFNLNANENSTVSFDDNQDNASSVLAKDREVQLHIQSTETTSVSKESKNWENLIDRCFSEVSNQSSKPKGSSHPEEISRIKTEPADDSSAIKTSETSSLAGACTNHCPSIQDIFGDVNVKDEPIDNLDDTDMTIEAFHREIKKLTNFEEEEKKIQKSIAKISSTPQKIEHQLSERGLFEDLIKEETKTLPGNKNEKSSAAHLSVKKESKDNCNIAQDENGYSSDSSLGPLQIDEGEQACNEEETIKTTSNITVPSVPTASLILPSVNIISPFKIKILFGAPQVQVEKQHELFASANAISAPVVPVVGTSGNFQNTLVANNVNLQTQKLIEEDDSGTDSSPAVTSFTSLTCAYCQTVSPDIEALAKHFEDHLKDGLIICYFCQKSFGDKTSLKRHMRTHTGEKPYLCKVCGKRFSLPGNFKKHRDIHEDIRTEPCKICGKTFRRKEHLKYHMRTHTGEKPYTCGECGTSFTARYSLQIHMNIHLGKKPYKCSFCTKAFSDKSTMRKHIRVHTGEKPFHCQMCGRCFGESGTLAAHMATHRTERPFKCTQCPLSFKTSGGLRQHEKVHIGLKQYACKYCGVKFLQKYNMTMHERIHTGEKPYSCNKCDRSFRSRSCLAKHVVLHGGEEERRYECEHCNNKFYRKAHLRRHINTHLGIKNFECKTCEKKFCSRGSLESHVHNFHSQGARRFPCPWCGRVFKRRVYINTHECIRDPVKVEEFKKELRAAAAAVQMASTSSSSSNDNPPRSEKQSENPSDANLSCIDIKTEPDDEAADGSFGLGKIASVIGNATFDVQQDIKQEPS